METEEFMMTIRDDRPTLVDFYAPWCGPCKMMHPVIDDFREECGDKINVVKVDVDRHGELAARFGVQSIPTLILFRREEILWRHAGILSLSALREAVRKKLSLADDGRK